MKNIYLSILFSLAALPAFAQSGRWTWLTGDASFDQPGSYGQKNIAHPSNNPSSREAAITWSDNDGNLWLFGGKFGVDCFNDLWRYEIKTNTWIWINGSNKPNGRAVYGSKRITNAEVRPGARHSAVRWIDLRGNLWMFGGEGYDRDNRGLLNDLWMYDRLRDRWVWISGSDETNGTGIYGTRGVFDHKYVPGSRKNAVSWVDERNGLLYLFGGFGYSQEQRGPLNDLWLYNIREDVWTWISGSEKPYQKSQYHRYRNLSDLNMPGSRDGAAAWRDQDNNLWMFGGNGYGKTDPGSLNDLWKFDTQKWQWEWAGGTTELDHLGHYGRKGSVDNENLPPARSGAVTFTDRSGDRWLFGGIIYLGEMPYRYNDLWKQDHDSRLWTWISGDNQGNQPGNYGSRGVEHEKNKPGARSYAGAWSDRESNLYVFGGTGQEDWKLGLHNDLWVFRQINIRQQPALVCPANLTFRTTEKSCIAHPRGLAPKILYTRDTAIIYRLSGATKGSGNGVVDTDFNLGVTVVNYMLAHDTTISCSFTITVADQIKPRPTQDSLPNIYADCSIEIKKFPTAIDNCAGTITGSTESPLSFSIPGIHVITWTYDDGNGNKTTQKQRVIIADRTGPVPTVESLPGITGECHVRINKKPTAIDECEGTIVGTTKDPLEYSLPGTYTITWTYRDSKGNETLQKQIVIVKSSSGKFAPLLDPLPDIIAECAATVVDIPKAAKNCGGIISAQTKDPLKYDKQGTYLITWLYNDGNGNKLEQTQKVIIKDRTVPVPTVKSLPDLIGECSVTVHAIPTANDNCRGSITATTRDPLQYNKPGTYLVTWIYSDNNGNGYSQMQKVVVRGSDGLKPMTDKLPDIIGECSATVTDIPKAVGNCGTVVEGTTTNQLNYNVPGTFIITWIYKDANGNSLQQTQKIIVKDSEAPVPDMNALPDIVSECSANIETRPSATDNCIGFVHAKTTDPLKYTKAGSYKILWTYEDASGNRSTQVQNVIVKQSTGKLVPLIAALPDITGECMATVSVVPQAAKDCGPVFNGSTKDRLSYSTPGTHLITWMYSDGNGQILEQKQRVIITDRTKPVPSVTTLPDITGDCSASITSTPTATDNCAGLIKGTTTDPVSYNKKGTHIVNWKFSDGNGNTTIQQQRVIVKNESAFNSNLEALNTIEGNCEVLVTKKPTIRNACGRVITATTQDPLSYNKAGTYTINWTYKISESQSLTQTQKVIVKDDKMPVPLFESLPDIIAFCSVKVNAIPRAVDNCAGIIKASTTDTLFYDAQGEYTIKWIYDDGNGNITSQTQKVIVKGEPITVTVMPNPTTNHFQLNIRLCDEQKPATLYVYDMLGRMVETQEVKSLKTINLGTYYPAAPYLIVVMQGDEKIAKKIFKIRG